MLQIHVVNLFGNIQSSYVDHGRALQLNFDIMSVEITTSSLFTTCCHFERLLVDWLGDIAINAVPS